MTRKACDCSRSCFRHRTPGVAAASGNSSGDSSSNNLQLACTHTRADYFCYFVHTDLLRSIAAVPYTNACMAHRKKHAPPCWLVASFPRPPSPFPPLLVQAVLSSLARAPRALSACVSSTPSTGEVHGDVRSSDGAPKHSSRGCELLQSAYPRCAAKYSVCGGAAGAETPLLLGAFSAQMSREFV